MEDLMSVLHHSLFTHVHKYISVLLDFSLFLLQSNLTRKIKANIQARGAHSEIPLILQNTFTRTRARAQLTLIVFYRSRRHHLVVTQTISFFPFLQ